MKPTLKKNLPIEVYHRDDGHISTSRLKEMLKSPLHFRYPKKYESKAFTIGSLTHSYLLEPHLVEKEYFFYDETKRPNPEKTFRDKENKEWQAKIFKENEGKTVVTVKEREQCLTMTERVLEDPMVCNLLEGPGWNEASIYWTDYKRGANLKTRPDRIRANMVIVDVKTAADASPEGFAKALGNFRYDIQAAMQIDGVEAKWGKKVPYYFYIVIEKEPPYAHGVYLLKPDAIWTGRNTYKALLDVWRECMDNNEWPSYAYWAKNQPDKILRTQLPHYITTSLFQY